MKKVLASLILAVLCSCSKSGLYRELDKTLDKSSEYELAFNRRLDSLKNELTTCPDTDKWEINRQLFDCYVRYKLDSCLKYVTAMESLAGNDKAKRIMGEARLVKLLHRKNCHNNAVMVYENIDTSGMDDRAFRIYYAVGHSIYNFLSEHSLDGEYYLRKSEECTWMLWNHDSTDIKSVQYMALLLQRKGNAEKAVGILERFLKTEINASEKSIANYALGDLYIKLGDNDKAVPYLVESACIDIRLVIKNNTSLYLLAGILYEDGKIKRSSRYLARTIENNRFCNYENLMFRNSQLDRLMSATIIRQNNIRNLISLAVICLGIIFTIVLTMLIRKLKQYNIRLKEASRNKNILISHFVELSTDYIYNVDGMKSKLRKTAKEQGTEALMKLLRTTPFADSEFSNFKKTFDEFFLWMYPNFVSDVNTLMSDGHKLVKPEDGLGTDLRMLALIWLGITDRQKLAKILHLSEQSVYTYHSLIQKASLFPDGNLDEAVGRMEQVQ